MFELPTSTPTMWERAGRAVFGSVGRGLRKTGAAIGRSPAGRIAQAGFGSSGRAVRSIGIAFWRWPLRRPLLLTAGGTLTIIGAWSALHEPFNWQDVESERSFARFLIATGILLASLGIRKAEAPKN